MQGDGDDYPILKLDDAGKIVVNDGGSITKPSEQPLYTLEQMNAAGVRLIRWPEMQWNPSIHSDHRALKELIESGDYPMLMIRVGEDFDDVEKISAFSSDSIYDALGCFIETEAVIKFYS